MKQDGPGIFLNDTEGNLNQNGVGCPTVDSLYKGRALVDIPTAPLSVIIHGLSERAKGEFDMS